MPFGTTRVMRRFAADVEPRVGQSYMLKKLVSLLLAFLAGLAGNIIAGWIQQDVWSNVFTPVRLIVTGVLALLILLLSVFLEKAGPALQLQRDSTEVTGEPKAELMEKDKETKTEVIRNSISALDNYEKAVLREFFTLKRNTIMMVPEDDAAVVGLLRKGIVHIVGEGRYLLGAGWVCPVSLSPTAESIIRGSSPEAIGFPPGVPTAEQLKEIQRLRPDFVLDIERSSW